MIRTVTNTMSNDEDVQLKSAPRRYVSLSALFVLLHSFFVLCRYGQLPIAPVLGDEVIINDASISLARGQGYAATSFTNSHYGIDRLFAHFPPLYPLTESLAFRAFGFSVYSLRLTTTVMSIATTIALALLLYRLCRTKLLNWDTAILISALYCTNPALIALERTARMESMIGLLVMLSLAAVLAAATRPVERTWPLTLAAGALGGLCLAVHPESITALMFLGPIILFAAPGRLFVRLASLSLFAIMPMAVWVLVFGKRSAAAFQQFRNILHYATPVDPGIGQWLRAVTHTRNISAIDRQLFLFLILLFMFLLVAAYGVVVSKLPHSSLRYRLGASLCVSGVLELVTMEWVLHLNDRRYQFLFGPLLIGLAIAALGAAPPLRWQRRLAWLLVIGQMAGVVGYLHARSDRIAADPDRFMLIVRSLPQGAAVAISPRLWLDFQESGRPFTLLYGGFDGEDEWAGSSTDPLDRFQAVALVESDCVGTLWCQEAAVGRTKHAYSVGGETVDVYLR